MASNKECLIIILDVRNGANEEFKKKSIKCVAEILKDKICGARKDYVSFVLLGTEHTNNEVYDRSSNKGYSYITQYPHVQLATWQLLVNFYKFVAANAVNKGQWLGALMVAIDMINNNEALRFQRQRIVLFYDFNEAPNYYGIFDDITKELIDQDIELIVISHNIKYLDNSESDAPLALFDSEKINDNQVDNEKHALRLVSSCNAKLCNFEEALSTVFQVQNRRPWCWNSILSIGSKINIKISGMLAVKDESHIKLRKCWTTKGETMTRERRFFFKDKEIDVEPQELIDGFMLGATPIAYDEALAEEKQKFTPGLKFLGFVKRDSILSEYYCGDSLYILVHQKGMHSSAKMLDALVKVLLDLDMVILCWKVFSVKFNKPKMVILLPNKLSADKPANMSMVELSYQVQHHFWDFAALCTKNTEFTQEQMEAIDELIDSMDLLMDEKNATKPRSLIDKDWLAFHKLPHIYEQNIMDVLERKIILNAGQTDEQFQEMLKDKNFVDVFWKVPEAIEEKSKNAAKKVKNLFPLEKSNQVIEKAKARAATQSQQTAAKSVPTDENELLDVKEVGATTPVEDFEKLLRLHVRQIGNSTMRDTEYQLVAMQMRNSIWQLLFKAEDHDEEKIQKALIAYRASCYEFSALEDYNKWIRSVKSKIMEKHQEYFWQKVIVKNNLGLCIFGKPTLEEQLQLDQFYECKDSSENQSVLTEKELDNILSQF